MGRAGAAVTLAVAAALVSGGAPGEPAHRAAGPKAAGAAALPADYRQRTTAELHRLHRDLDVAVDRLELELRRRREEMTAEQIYARYASGVVEVTAEGPEKTFRGTGFQIDAPIENSEGRMALGFATNFHVIAGASKITLKVPDGGVATVRRIVFVDRQNDLAIVDSSPHLSTIGLPLARQVDLFPRPNNPIIGSPVYVIGNPKGLQNSITQGIVSAIRDVGAMNMRLQITAPVSHGSSGSPVFNKWGEVIGVVASTNVEGQLLNFAIPSDYLVAQTGAAQPIPIADWPARSTRKPN